MIRPLDGFELPSVSVFAGEEAKARVEVFDDRVVVVVLLPGDPTELVLSATGYNGLKQWGGTQKASLSWRCPVLERRTSTLSRRRLRGESFSSSTRMGSLFARHEPA